jgi:hypothetical protein
MDRCTPSVTASSGLGREPQAAPPRHPRDTAPKGVETHPGDGRLSVGNSSIALFHIYHAWLLQPASWNELPKNKPIRPICRSLAHSAPARLDPRQGAALRRPGRAQVDATSIPARNSPRGTTRAARSHKNLRQVLKNMDSPREKSTVQSACGHFVSHFPSSTSPSIQKATRVDGGARHRAAQFLHPQVMDDSNIEGRFGWCWHDCCKGNRP